MKLKPLFQAVGLIAASAVLILVICLAGLLAFILQTSQMSQSWNAPVSAISDSLSQENGRYVFTGESYLEEDGLWAMLLDESGQVTWQWKKPEELPEQYTLTEVAAFSRWYLEDYPVQTWVREDGLLVIGAPQGSTWKYSFATSIEVVNMTPYWLCFLFLFSIACVLGISALFLRRWFRRAQQARDEARSDWINGVSHDIRTPLSMVMAYASQLENAPELPPQRREQAALIRRQSQTIRDLVNDLNLTMRLDYQMQPLRRASLSPAALVRQTAADALNSGLEEKFQLEVDIPPEAEQLTLEADGPLLHRALSNLVQNCIRHNPDGCCIAMGLRQEGNDCLFQVSNTQAPLPEDSPPQQEPPLPPGAAPHGTGLKLVGQIAKAHGGALQLAQRDGQFLCTLRLPLPRP